MQKISKRQVLKSILPTGLAFFFISKNLGAQTRPLEEPICPPPIPPEPKPSIINQISRNHGHLLVVTYEDVIVGKEKSYSIQGSSGHPHIVTILQEDFAKLRIESVIEIESSEDASHSHVVRIERQPIT